MTDRLRAAVAARVLGRSRKPEWLERALFEEAVPVVFVHGIGRIGKTTLLQAAELLLHARGARVYRFVGREIEAAPAGVLAAFGEALGCGADLERQPGVVASRDPLLESVWGQAHTGSNVVDAAVRSLRRKLGPYAGALQTVTGFGYKLVLEERSS